MDDGADPRPTGFIPVYTSHITIPMTEDMLMDMGLIPSPPLPPEPRMARWKRSMCQAYWDARWRLAEIVAGQPIGGDNEECW